MKHTNPLAKINNHGYKVKINHRQENGKTILFINYRPKNSKPQTKRIATLTGDRATDLNLINQAMLTRHNYEQNISKKINTPDLFSPNPNELTVISYIDTVKKGTRDRLHYLRKHVIDFAGEGFTIAQIDKQFINRFAEYIQKMIPKTARLYFAAFKSLINRATDEGFLEPIHSISKINIKYHSPKKEYLTSDELDKIVNAPYKDTEYKNAFLFACYTGLRYSDLATLKQSDIKDSRLTLTQQKTKETAYIDLCDEAIYIYNEQKEKHPDKEKLFQINSYSIWQKRVKQLITSANIDKHISGHCARHTFATLCITNDIDIYTTSSLMGHKNVNVTQIYANIVDKKKKDAIKRLPRLNRS